jgi:hypothetical protein
MADVPMFADLGSRRCRRCEVIKPLQDFPATLRTNGNVKFDSYCRPCRKAYQHEWYMAHRAEALAAAAERRDRDRANRPPRPASPERRPLREAIGFQTHANTRIQGNAGLGIAIAYFSRIGLQVAIPLTDTQPWDLIIENGDRLERVQVKTTTQHTTKQGSYVVGLKTVGCNTKRTVTRDFHPSDYDWLFVVCGDACVYLIPTDAIAVRTALYLGRKYEAFRLEG